MRSSVLGIDVETPCICRYRLELQGITLPLLVTTWMTTGLGRRRRRAERARGGHVVPVMGRRT